MTRRPVPDPLRQPASAARSGQLLWQACCAGREPAESLDPRDREDLVAGLAGRGWTDLEIAVLTHMTTYTTARIRDRIGLPPNLGPNHHSVALMRTA